jgi:hypothetical protein
MSTAIWKQHITYIFKVQEEAKQETSKKQAGIIEEDRSGQDKIRSDSVHCGIWTNEELREWGIY